MSFKSLFSAETIAAGLTAPLYPLRQRYYHWGATWLEVSSKLPGDGIVGQPQYVTTRAVEINARPQDIWPWLVQMGHGRAGFYSYLIPENPLGLDNHNADTIFPTWQQLDVGDDVRVTSKGRLFDLHLTVATIEPERSLVLRTPIDSQDVIASWSFVLRPIAPETTRLIVRYSADYYPDLRNVLLDQYVLELPFFLLERKMLQGIKQRAERTFRNADLVQSDDLLEQDFFLKVAEENKREPVLESV